jgi:outer membrane cobalamin receptor
MIKHFLVTAAVSTLTTHAVLAADDIIVVRTERLTGDELGGVERIGSATIELSADLAAALQTSPSVNVVTPGPAGATEILLRGGDANFTAVTIDGVRLNDVTDSRGGAVDVGEISSFEISGLQISKGAVSVLEGSDSLSGHIAMETKDPRDGARVEGMASYAEGDRFSAAGRITPFRNDIVAAAISGGYFDLGDAPGGQTYTRSNVGAKVIFEPSVGVLAASARYSETERLVFPDASGGDQYSVSGELEDAHAKLLTASLRFSANPEGGWTPGAALTYLNRREGRITPAIPPVRPAGLNDTEFERFTATVSASRDIVQNWKALFGAEIVHESGKAEGSLDFGFPVPVDFSKKRTTPSGFAELRRTSGADRRVADYDLYLGARADYIDTDKLVPTIRGGVAYHLAGRATTLFANVGTGYKSPSFYALGDPLVGNPQLKDERSVTGELGAQHRFRETTSLEFSAFYSHYTDLVDFDGATFSLVNRAQVDVLGVEAKAVERIGAHKIDVFATYMNTDAPEGAVLLRPDFRVGANWRFEVDRLMANASYVFRDKMEASSIPTGEVTLSGSHRADISVSYRFNKNLVISLRGDDLFDTEAPSQPGFTPFGRRVGVSIAAAY